jgi:acyl transferase domain-containing protein
VVSLTDALGLIATRAKATEDQAPEGAMLSVAMSEAEATAFLAEERLDDLAVAAVNSPVHLVLSGSHSSVKRAEDVLISRGVRATLLHVNRAFHSPMMKVCLKFVRFNQHLCTCAYSLAGAVLCCRNPESPCLCARLPMSRHRPARCVCAGCR